MERSVTIGSLSTHYTEHGSGTPILILHGWGSSAATWEAVQHQLATHGYRAIALDLPGFGATVEPPREWGLAEYTDFVREFVAQEKIGRFVLLGHSFGGRIAIDYAARFGESIAAVVLCGAAGIARPRSARRATISFLVRHGSFIAKAPMIRTLSGIARKAIYAIVGERDYYKASPVMRSVMSRVLEVPLAPLLPNIPQPVLLAWGDADEATPLSHARIAQDVLPDSTLAVFEGRGHSLQREVPRDLADRVARFLQEKNITP